MFKIYGKGVSYSYYLFTLGAAALLFVELSVFFPLGLSSTFCLLGIDCVCWIGGLATTGAGLGAEAGVLAICAQLRGVEAAADLEALLEVVGLPESVRIRGEERNENKKQHIRRGEKGCAACTKTNIQHLETYLVVELKEVVRILA